jgi:hypothetical protein
MAIFRRVDDAINSEELRFTFLPISTLYVYMILRKEVNGAKIIAL